MNPPTDVNYWRIQLSSRSDDTFSVIIPCGDSYEVLERALVNLINSLGMLGQRVVDTARTYGAVRLNLVTKNIGRVEPVHGKLV